MHHRRTDSGRRAALPISDRGPFAMPAAWLLALGCLSAAARASDETDKAARDPRASASVSARLDRELREHVRPLLDRFCLKCHSSKEPEADVRPPAVHLDGRGPSRGVDVAEGRRRAGQGRDAAAGGPPAEARGSPDAPRLGRPLSRLRGPRERRRPGPGRHAAAEQRRIYPDDPRPHRRRARPGARVPPGRRRRRGVHQHRRRAGHVAGPAGQVPRRRQGRRRPRRPPARRLPVLPRRQPPRLDRRAHRRDPTALRAVRRQGWQGPAGSLSLRDNRAANPVGEPADRGERRSAHWPTVAA